MNCTKATLLLYLILTLNHNTSHAQNIDSLKIALKTAKHDTVKVNTLFWLVEATPEGEWQKHNEQYLQFTKNKVSTTSNSSENKFFKQHYARALNNLGFIESELGDLKKAVEHYKESLKIREEIGDKSGIASCLNNIGNSYEFRGDYETALDYYKKSIKLKEEVGNKEGIASSLNNIASIYQRIGKTDLALENFKKSLKIRREINNKDGIAISLNNMGGFYDAIGNIPKAIESFNESLKICEEIGDKNGQGLACLNLGGMYEDQGELVNAKKYYYKSLKFFSEIGYKEGEGTAYVNIATMYKNENKIDTALKYFNKALEIYILTEDELRTARVYNNLAVIEQNAKNFERALTYYDKALTIQQKYKDKQGMAFSLKNIGTVHYKKKDLAKAIQYGKQSLEYSLELGFPTNIKNVSELLYKCYKETGNYPNALENYERYIKMRDSLENMETQKATIKQQTNYEYEKKKVIADKENEFKLKQQEEKASAEKTKQNVIIGSVSLVLIIVAVFSIFLYNRFKVTQRQKVIIEIKEKETLQQKHIIEEKHKEITDSISYAERIQRSFLATKEVLDENLPMSEGMDSYFVLFKPKDVVSGDFYWASMLNNGNFAFATADSTGHGVPGAIMSLLNITSLEKAIERTSSPSEILNLTRKTIIERLKKDGSLEGGKDGMDCSLMSLDRKNMKLEVAAANNPVWIVRKTTSGEQELIEVKPDKMPVGKHDKDRDSFSLHTIELQKGDTIYALTDGFPDQFGGSRGKKFMSKKLKELILSSQYLNLAEQKIFYERTFIDWVGDLEQIDDVTLMGIRV